MMDILDGEFLLVQSNRTIFFLNVAPKKIHYCQSIEIKHIPLKGR